jgi:hypothetical protein
MAGDPGKGDAERSVRNAGRDEDSCHLVDHAMPRAGVEMPPVDVAFGEPQAGAVRTSGFLERAAMDPDRICHGTNPFWLEAWRRAEALSRSEIRENPSRAQAIKRGTGGKRDFPRGDREGGRPFPSARNSPVECRMITKRALGRSTAD